MAEPKVAPVPSTEYVTLIVGVGNEWHATLLKDGFMQEVYKATALTDVIAYATKNFVGWTGSATILSPSGNRTPSTVTVDTSDASGTLHVDLDWAAAVGYTP